MVRLFKKNHSNSVKLCYMDIDRYIIQVKTKDVFADLVKDAEKRFNTPSYEVSKP